MAEPFQIEIGIPSSLIQTSNFSCTSFNVLGSTHEKFVV